MGASGGGKKGLGNFMGAGRGIKFRGPLAELAGRQDAREAAAAELAVKEAGARAYWLKLVT